MPANPIKTNMGEAYDDTYNKILDGIEFPALLPEPFAMPELELVSLRQQGTKVTFILKHTGADKVFKVTVEVKMVEV